MAMAHEFDEMTLWQPIELDAVRSSSGHYSSHCVGLPGLEHAHAVNLKTVPNRIDGSPSFLFVNAQYHSCPSTITAQRNESPSNEPSACTRKF